MYAPRAKVRGRRGKRHQRSNRNARSKGAVVMIIPGKIPRTTKRVAQNASTNTFT
jgi:hypothetical protein